MALSATDLRRWLAVVGGPLLACLLWVFTDLDPSHPAVTRMAGIAAWMAVWWLTEAVPLAVTALLPIVLFPLLGVQSGKATATTYFNHIIFLFLGGFIIALAMERWNLHRRIALRILLLVGGGPARIILGFMLVTAFLSMWISNTAAAMMLVPMAMAVIHQIEEDNGRDATRPFTTALLLGVAYSASAGGIATLIGTPPNLAFAQIFALTFPSAPEINFADWILLALPISAAMLLIIWLMLTRVLFRFHHLGPVDRAMVAEEYRSLGRMKAEERWVLAVFVTTAVLWMSRQSIETGFVTIPGWSSLFPDPSLFDDGTVAIAMASLLFVLPAGGGRGVLMDWASTLHLPWNIVLLFGGGFALASGMKSSGLGDYLGQEFQAMANVTPMAMMAGICLLMTFLTELTSNTATTQMILPIVAAVSVAIHTHPLLLMIPATISASCAFMMPVATPPNAIVFGSGKLRIRDMARAGLVLNLVGVAVVTTGVYFLGLALFDIDPHHLPTWAVAK
jgi:sodium-dependent dicarboxylate transporter 2/3/5